MAKSFSDLEKTLTPESAGRAKGYARDMMREMLLAELRKAAAVTREPPFETPEGEHSLLAQSDSQDDMSVGSLSRLVAALGGKLEIIAQLPAGEVRLSQFREVG